jgi:aminoglycoside phosphotransferase (APT) family kinase protein
MSARAARTRILAVSGITAEPTWRETRWLALGQRAVALAADDDVGWARLRAEAALLARWVEAGVPAPRVLDVDDARRVMVRERVDGLTGDDVEPRIFGGAPPADRSAATVSITDFGARLAARYGELAARIHDAATPADAIAIGLGPRGRVDLDEASSLLARWGASPTLLAAIADARPWLERYDIADAVVHGDLHFHNMCLAPDGTITGVFDVGDAGIDESWAELQYVHSLGRRFAEIAIDTYARHRGIAVDEERAHRAHVRVALGHVRWHPPGSPRHLKIVAWIEQALALARRWPAG